MHLTRRGILEHRDVSLLAFDAPHKEGEMRYGGPQQARALGSGFWAKIYASSMGCQNQRSIPPRRVN